MTQSQNIDQVKIKVSGIDRVTGSEAWGSTIGEMKSWDLSDDQIDSIMAGQAVKCFSPNGRRSIVITLA